MSTPHQYRIRPSDPAAHIFEVTVTVEHEGRSYRGHGTSVDIVEAGCRACLEVMNRILRRKQHSGPGKPNPEQATI